MRPLTLGGPDDRVAIYGPVVVEVSGLEPVVTVQVLHSSDGSMFEYDPGDSALHPIETGTVNYASDMSTAMFTARSTTYVVRRIVDEDGLWASTLGAVVPADSLEFLYQGGIDMADPVESLWVAIDPDTDEVQELIYSSRAGVYARSSGAWQKYSDDDVSLDGVESIDVNGDAIQAFDDAEDSRSILTRPDVERFAIPDEEE